VKILAADNMKQNKFKTNFETVHAECVGKTPKFFHRKLILISRNKYLKK
jgi:hypothetical protein